MLWPPLRLNGRNNMIDCKQLMIHDYVSVGENFPSPAKVLEILYEGEECIFNLNGKTKNRKV